MVNSLPVPAVVGMATRGTPLRGTLFTPPYWRRVPPLPSRQEAPLAASMALPPPTATRQSTPAALASS